MVLCACMIFSSHGIQYDAVSLAKSCFPCSAAVDWDAMQKNLCCLRRRIFFSLAQGDVFWCLWTQLELISSVLVEFSFSYASLLMYFLYFTKYCNTVFCFLPYGFQGLFHFWCWLLSVFLVTNRGRCHQSCICGPLPAFESSAASNFC